MPKSYELKLREVEERRRPKPKEELYKAVEGQPQKMMIGFDHPESLQFELQLTWVEDTFTIDETHDYLMSEVSRLDGEYRRRPLRSNYSQKYLWFDRFVLRPRIQGRDLVLQDYGIEPGYRIKVSPFYQSEQIWGQPYPFDLSAERSKDQLEPCEDPQLLLRLDKGPPGAVNRFFFFPWLGGNSSAYIPVVQKMPKDVACYALDMPGRGDREASEGYPNGVFAIKVIAMTLAQEMRKSGNNYIFAHSQGSHFAYYVVKLLRSNFNVSVKALFVSNFAVPTSIPSIHVPTLRDRQDVCVPMKIFTRLIKGGWGCDPKLGFKNHMGWQAYQSQELWPVARSLIMDHWITKDFPLPGADQALQCPIVAFYGVEDAAVSEEAVMQWQSFSSDPDKFKLIRMQGGHLWFQNSSAKCEELANELASLMKKFR